MRKVLSLLLCGLLMVLAGCNAESTGGSAVPGGSFELRDPKGAVQFTVADLASAEAIDLGEGTDEAQYVIHVVFSKEAAERLSEYTLRHMGESLSLYVDGELISAPMIMNQIEGGALYITGEFAALADAQKVVDAIYGARDSAEDLMAVDSPFDLRDEDGEVQFTLGDVADVTVIEIDTGAATQYGVQITWTNDGAGRFAEYAASHMGETLTLFVDGKEMSGYKIPRMITGDTLTVGQFDSRAAAQAIVDGMKEVQPM